MWLLRATVPPLLSLQGSFGCSFWTELCMCEQVKELRWKLAGLNSSGWRLATSGVETVETLTGLMWKLGTSQVTGRANRHI